MDAISLPVLGALGLLLALVPALWRRWPDVRLTTAIAFAIAVVAIVDLAITGPRGLPTSGLVFLKEGRETDVIAAMWERDAWAGGLVADWVHPFRATVWIHHVEAMVGLALVAVIARAHVGATAAWALAATVATSAWFFHAGVSEGPAMPVTLAGLLAALAAGVDRRKRTPTAVALVAWALLTLAAAELRRETLVLSLPVLGWAVLEAARPQWAEALSQRWARPSVVARVVLAVLASSVGLALVDAAMQVVPTPSTVSLSPGAPWSVAHWTTLRLPIDLLGFTPVGFAVLAMVGWVVALTRSPPWALLAVCTITAARMYATAGHRGAAPFETLRYGALLLPALVLLAVAGAAWLGPRLGRWAPALWAAVGLSAALPRPLSPAGVDPWPLVPVSTVHQAGARFLLESAEAAPRCLLVTRLATQALDRTGDHADWTWRFDTAVYGGSVRAGSPLVVSTTPSALASPDGDAPDVLATAPCVRFVRGLDCNLPGADCNAWADGGETLVEATVDLGPFNTHHGTPRRPARFELLRMR